MNPRALRAARALAMLTLLLAAACKRSSSQPTIPVEPPLGPLPPILLDAFADPSLWMLTADGVFPGPPGGPPGGTVSAEIVDATLEFDGSEARFTRDGFDVNAFAWSFASGMPVGPLYVSCVAQACGLLFPVDATLSVRGLEIYGE